MRMPGRISVFEAEAVGVKEALSWLTERPPAQYIVETDSLMVVQALQRHHEYLLEVGNIIEACRSSIASLGSVKVVFVRKLGNRVAHLLARVPCSVNSYNLFESPPHVLLETLVDDLKVD